MAEIQFAEPDKIMNRPGCRQLRLALSSYWRAYRHSSDNEQYIAQYKMYVSGFGSSPYGIEWMRFEPGSCLPEIIRTVLHVAFEVDDLE